MKKIIDWFKLHWHGKIFKFFVYFGIFDIYMITFHNQEYSQFTRFIFLEALEQFITNIISDKTLISAIGIALSGLIPIIIKLITIYFKKDKNA